MINATHVTRITLTVTVPGTKGLRVPFHPRSENDTCVLFRNPI